MSAPIKFKHALIIGLGLIGGSFAHAIRKFTGKISAFDPNPDSLKFALNHQIIDDTTDLKSQDLTQSDLIIIAPPLASYPQILTLLDNKTSANAVIFDTGSLKSFVAEILPDSLKPNFVPTHPIAGSEKSGITAARADLFLGKKIIICKTRALRNDILDNAIKLFTQIGCTVDYLDPQLHDRIYALVSHLPQLLSLICPEKIPDSQFLQRALRLQNSSLLIWDDIFRFNQHNLNEFATKFLHNLEDIKEKISSNNWHEFTKAADSARTKVADILTGIEDPKIKLDLTILARIALIISFLQIEEIKEFKNYAGPGFKDFISPLLLVKDGEEFPYSPGITAKLDELIGDLLEYIRK